MNNSQMRSQRIRPLELLRTMGARELWLFSTFVSAMQPHASLLHIHLATIIRTSENLLKFTAHLAKFHQLVSSQYIVHERCWKSKKKKIVQINIVRTTSAVHLFLDPIKQRKRTVNTEEY